MINYLFIVSNGDTNHYFVKYESGYYRCFDSATSKIQHFVETAKNCEITRHENNVIEYEYFN